MVTLLQHLSETVFMCPLWANICRLLHMPYFKVLTSRKHYMRIPDAHIREVETKSVLSPIQLKPAMFLCSNELTHLMREP
jgi:hypothetical protein